MKYTTVKVSGVIISIAKTTDVKGYSVGVLESFLPDDEELDKWTQQETEQWTRENNKRMIAVCDFLNKNNL